MLVCQSIGKNIKKARKILKNGGVIIYPTDTLYGLGADIFNREAVERIFRIKGRDFKKPLSIMVSSLKQIKNLAWVNQKQEKLIKTILPGPFTVLLKKKKKISYNITAGSEKVGLRIPASKICRQLSKDMPITTTSANVSGFQPDLNINKIAKKFKNQTDFILKGERLSGQPSIIIDLTEEPFTIFRF